MSQVSRKYVTHRQLPVAVAFWTPCNFVTAAFVPIHLRIPFLSAVSTSYICLLSTVTRQLDTRSAEAGKAA